MEGDANGAHKYFVKNVNILDAIKRIELNDCSPVAEEQASV